MEKHLLRVSAGFRLVLFFGFCAAIAPGVMVLGLVCDAFLGRVTESPGPLTRGLMRLRVEALRWSCKIVCFICGVEISKSGAQFSQRQGLILANHMSYLDVVAIGSVYPCSFVAKHEISQWPLIGLLTRGLGCVFLDRFHLGSRVRTLRELRKRLALHDICVFPEGTTTSGRVPCAERWQTGQAWAALGHDAGVLAVAVSYDDHDAAVWIDDMAFLSHLWRLLCRGNIRAHLSTTPLRMVPLDAPGHGIQGGIRELSLAALSRVTDLGARVSFSVQALQVGESFVSQHDPEVMSR